MNLVIGLETHIQLTTNSKLFSSAATQYGASPNSQVSFVDAGLPGVLPVLNKEAILMALRFALAINGEIQNCTYFERKNYFYPDLPKGYQISQLQEPIIRNGKLAVKIADELNWIEIERAHLEEDAGKSIHTETCTLIDLNRAGNPLLEIVTSPCFNSTTSVIAYLKTLQQLVRFLDICDGNMQEGSFRCDVNISLKPANAKKLGTRVEIKNLNSFRFIEEAINYEYERQLDLLEQGKQILQETRLYSPEKGQTFSMRTKENEFDYRYFADPDLLPIHIDKEMLAEAKAKLPELPQEIYQRLEKDELIAEDIEYIMQSPALVKFYDAVKRNTPATGKNIANWMKQFQNCTDPKLLADILQRLTEQQLSSHQAKILLQSLLDKPGKIDARIKELGIGSGPDLDHITKLCEQILKKHPQQVAEYKAGKTKILSFFVGQIMKETKGKADPESVQKILQDKLGSVDI